ncbi:MAG: tyrosine--tRNA ligase [Actinomycetota bacterium]|nr:tyrosine--tRNA ligase [Actinomycetota bacterium]
MGSPVPVSRQIELLKAGAVDVISEDELCKKIAMGRPLRVKLGIDPTASDIHLGFAVVLRRLRLFQDLGHKAVLILGDFTAQVGDPSQKSVTRPRLSKDEVDMHAASYLDQIGAILDQDPDKLEVRRNSEWLSTIDMEGVLRLTAQVTVARMLERDDFANRYAAGTPISLMEFLYPLLQATDSVEIQADVELGGTDQLFNLLMGRHLQERNGQAPQIVLTTPLLVGTDGVQKMSKSLGNYIAITEPPAEQFGKLMRVPDELLPNYFQYATAWDPEDVARVTAELAGGGLHPNAAKRLLARTVVDLYHGDGAGAVVEAEFDRVFKAHEVPSEMPEITVPDGTALSTVLVEGLGQSGRQARRVIDEGGVKVDGEVVRSDDPVPAGEHVVQIGRRSWVKVHVKPVV